MPGGIDALWDHVAGLAGRLLPRASKLMACAESIVAVEKKYRHLSDKQLQRLALSLGERFRLKRETARVREKALVILREVAARQTGLRPFSVQVAGALALEAGLIVEMATGEGKTLTAAMGAVFAGWRGRGCHVITVNDYLAKRDASALTPFFAFCGLTVDYLETDMAPARRREAYRSDVTYATNKAVAADFLHDQLAVGRLRSSASAILQKITRGNGFDGGQLIQRGLACAIVDEADSVLIDEAATPLILSGEGQNPDQLEAFHQASRWAEKLDPNRDIIIDRHHREIELTSSGKARLSDLAAAAGGVWAGARRREELVVQALVAREFFLRDKQYVIENGKILIVDEFTGRLMPDRSWQNGLHQAIEAKEGLEINLPKETVARISFQRFFRLYEKLSGMTGTGLESRTEFWKIYRLPVVVIPKNRPCVRDDMPDHVYASATAKWAGVVEEIRRVHETGRPVLVGTRSVRDSEHLSRLLKDQRLPHRVLNAVRHEAEAEIVAQAGRSGHITVATNMAGRGTDIRLEAGVDSRGGLHVIATERHEAGRIDRQLYGRAGRQGDPGSARAFVSLEDDLLHRYARLLVSLLSRIGDDGRREISSRVNRWVIGFAQRRAERAAHRRRTEVLRSDKWIDEHLGFTGGGY